MGRPRKRQRPHPPCFYESHGAYYHVLGGVWYPLGRDLPEALAEYGRRTQPRTTEHQLDAVLDATFEAVRKMPRKKPWAANTVKQYKDSLKKLKHLLRQFSRPDQVKQKDAAQVKVLLAGTPTFANHTISLARSIWNYLLEQQAVPENPFVAIKRYETASRTRLLQWEEWWGIHKVAPRRLQLVMDGLYLLDQRIGDVLKIDVRHALEEGVYVKQEKTGKELLILWNPDLRAWWAACLELHPKVVKVAFEIKDRPRPLFRSRHGTAPNYRTVYDQWTLACERAGVADANLHDNRAFSATEARKQGLDPQALLGHDSARTTKIYLRGRWVEAVEGPAMKKILGA